VIIALGEKVFGALLVIVGGSDHPHRPLDDDG
jgi:hypothetical protein